MKARAGLLILLTLMFSLTGFSTTTTDLAQNSTTEEVHQDLSVNVVATSELEAVQSNDVSEVSSNVSISGTHCGYAVLNKAKAANDLNDHESLNELFDVGWRNCNTDILTPEHRRDPGGVMSLFYA